MPAAPRGNQAALDELAHHRPHAIVDDELRQDQQRQREQQPDLGLDVVEERQRDAGPGVPFDDRQHEQRHPGQCRQHDQAAAQHLQRIAGQMRSPQELKEWPAKDQGEVGRFVHGRCDGLAHVTP